MPTTTPSSGTAAEQPLPALPAWFRQQGHRTVSVGKSPAIRVPGQKRPGEASGAVVETINIYPTLAVLAGLSLSEALDGRSLVPQLADPTAVSDGMAAGFWQGSATLRTDRHRLIILGKDRTNVQL